MPHFIITALGSYGDVHPMVGLGSALAARGHRVQIVSNPYFEDVVTGAGLELLPYGTRDEYVELSQHPDLWHPIRGPKFVLSHTACRLRELYKLIVSHCTMGETVFCAHPLDFASRIIGEKFGAPVASIDLAPGMLWSVHDSPRLKGALLGPRVPRWLKREQFWFADRWVALPLMGSQLNGLRQELGLAPVQRIFSHWLHSTDLILGLYPDWFGPPAARLAAQHTVGRFPALGFASRGPTVPRGVARFSPPARRRSPFHPARPIEKRSTFSQQRWRPASGCVAAASC